MYSAFDWWWAWLWSVMLLMLLLMLLLTLLMSLLDDVMGGNFLEGGHVVDVVGVRGMVVTIHHREQAEDFN